MRAITAMGICDECGPQVYSSNAVTKELASPDVSDGVKSMLVKSKDLVQVIRPKKT